MSLWRQLGIMRDVQRLDSTTRAAADSTNRPLVRAVFTNHRSGEITIDITDLTLAIITVIVLILAFIILLTIQYNYYRKKMAAPILNETEVELVPGDLEEPRRPRTRSQTAILPAPPGQN